NPLYIYGQTGMGKTHLLHAIGNKIIQNMGLKVCYITSEKFAFEYVSALKEKRLEKFIKDFRNVDVLMMDDIQFLGGKVKMQEEFFHAFNELYHLNKQIVVTADRPPSKLNEYNPRLLSRLQSGLIVDLQLPDYESRVEIIRKKCQNDGTELNDIVIDYIAQNVKTNVRELEGIIIRMLAQSSLLDEELNLDLAMKIIVSLSHHLKFGKNQNLQSVITVDDILQVMSDVYAKPVALIKGPSRKRDIAQIRKMAVYCSKKFTDENLVSIARSFDRSHAFVLYSISDIENLLKKEPDLNYQVDQIEKMLFSTKR
ncbi:MAG: chromosomal replication initiator protein DnaA, partial [Calditrichia bacterium]|nr:chromosomal replication initiator protein DnaA [Calditrichia bacterium]